MRISMLPPETIEALKQFVLEQDKSYPPTFVGRKDIIKTIRDTSELVYMKYKNDSFQHAATQLVHGAPGLGNRPFCYIYRKLMHG